MMKKKMFAVLLCALLMGALSGCGSKSESVTQSDAETETSAAESQMTEAESAVTTESKSETETETTAQESETAAAETTGTTTAVTTTTTVEMTATTTAATAKAAPETAAAVQTEKISQKETTVQQQEENNPPDEPAHVSVETEAPTQQIEAPDPDISTTVPAETEPQKKELSMTVTYQGHSITVGENASDFVAAVPADSFESAPSCYGNGENINYYYENEGMILYVWNENDNYLAYGLDIFVPGIASVDGLDIGSSVTFDGEKTYDMGNDCSIMIEAVGGVVNMISYNKNLPGV